ncbi:MAG: PQQ-binding-like beta-propeller repeat protein, partial [Pirellulales bacterium]
QHGGEQKIAANGALQAAYEQRKKIATGFLDLMRRAYEKKRLKPPFDDERTLHAALASAAKRSAEGKAPEVRVRAVLPTPDAQRHWPAFRGPTGQGIVFDAQAPAAWSDTQNVLWKTKLPGRGNSSVVTWGDRLFVTAESEPRAADAPLAARDEAPDRLLLCYALSGEQPGRLLWKYAAPRPKQHEVLYWKNTLASSTPVVDGERVIAFFGNAGLVCCDLDGKRLWEKDLGTFPTMHGPGSTPVLWRDLVILIQDQTQGTPLCAAFDKRTGSQVWRHKRPNSMCWSSPVLLRVDDHDELVYNGSDAVVALDPATGDTIWTAKGTSAEAIPMIVSGGGLLYSASGRNGPVFAIRPGGKGDVTATHVVWRLERGGPHVPTPLYHEGRLYLVSDTGIVTCLDAATGETLAQKRLRGRFSASPFVVGERIYFVSEEGVTYVAKCDPKLEIVAQNDLKETNFATPAVLGGRMYFRTADHVIAIGK